MPNSNQSEIKLARLITRERPPVPHEIRATALEHVADFAGVAVAGAGSAAARSVTSLLAPASSPFPGASRLWGRRGGWLPARDAALVNAIAGHVDDFDDDETDTSLAHPTVTVLSAAAAAADLVPTNGKQFIDAYVAGVEVLVRLGSLLNPAHYKRGFHATATLGALGATAAVGSVLSLTPGRCGTRSE